MSIKLIRNKGKFALLIFSVLFASALFLGCEGDDGATGQAGLPGPPGLGADPQGESCEVCHSETGDEHQAYYDQLYQDDVIRVVGLGVAYTAPNIVTTTFTMTKKDAAGVDQPFNCEDADSVGIYWIAYTGTGFEMPDASVPPDGAADRFSLKPSISSSNPLAPFQGTTTTVGDGATGLCTVTGTYNDNVADFTGSNGLVVVYGRDEDVGRLPVRVRQARYPFAALLETGTVDYASAANNDGCEKCHTVPFLKHGYIYGQVAGDPTTDFYACKACHLDNGEGGHFIWQLLVDNPQLIFALEAEYGEDWEGLAWEAGDSRILPYAYTTRLMNDVHMSHAMEFPYPQSMSNCATCHENKLTALLTDANFTGETCKSCHAVTGPGHPKQAPALATIMPAIHGTVDADYIDTTPCINCHDGTLPNAPLFSEIHSGYNQDLIYADAVGNKFSDAITVSVDNATLAGTDLTIDISASGTAGGLDSADIVPAVLIGLYGYDTKDFIVNGHDRWDSNCNGTISRSDGDQPIGEYIVGEEVAGCPNPYWTLVSEAPGAWTITAHLSTWADMINDGTIKRVEVGVMPELENADGELVGLNAVSRTFVLATGAFDDNFFGHEIVDVGKCNNCHDQLATTFHDGDRGGSITVCRMCHVGLRGGSHLEMQSRSIDSYVHAVHSFQAFDIGDIDFSDPLEALHYEHHTEFVFPTLGIRNCEGCHNADKYNVPDQSKSLPGVLSAADDVTTKDRNIGAVPSYVTGPATRACGACHRAHAINEDNASELASFFTHWRSNGYLVEDGDILDVIDDIFTIL